MNQENFCTLLNQLQDHYTLDTNLLREKIEIFCKTLLEWNKIHSLSGIKDKKDIFEYLFDSILPLMFINPLKKTDYVLDIGSGAGFPSIPLSLITSSHFILTEPKNKKTSFLQNLKIALNAENLEILPLHFEKLDYQRYHFSLITSRATMPLNQLLLLTKPFKRKTTQLLFYKGSRLEEEIKNLQVIPASYKIFTHQKRKYFWLK